MRYITQILLISCLTLLIHRSVTAQQRLQSWADLDLFEDQAITNMGFDYKLGSLDRRHSGLMLRGNLAYGGYEYDADHVPGNEVDGDYFALSASAGYQHQIYDAQYPTRLAFYLGFGFEQHDLTPKDNLNPTRGSELGMKFRFETDTRIGMNFHFASQSEYNTAFDTYFVQMRPAYIWSNMRIGPELVFLGNTGFDQQRFGISVADIALDDLGIWRLNAAAGFADGTRSGSDSTPYGNFRLKKSW